ncbi:PAS domain S-box protein [Marinobacter fonticola]|uniref:PAS domain S-box protein n=1 Tax=Marinobacter fonticola TaxID=2603215 RepID=UPI0011E61C23|nr:PAS domain S-box protein [Marinobacter fonticola]
MIKERFDNPRPRVKDYVRKHALRYFLPSALVLLLAVTGVLALVFESRLGDEVLSDLRARLETTTRLNKNIVAQHLTEYSKDVHFLLDAPAVRGLARASQNDGIDPVYGTSYEEWAGLLETVFVSLLQNHGDIDQARIIGAGPQGRELLRVDRLSGKIDIVSRESLQRKARTEYFEPAINLEPRELYISSITLNREFGEIEFPYRPTVRVAGPIFSDDDNRFGFFILNINAKPILEEVRQNADKGQVAIVADSQGHIIEHINEGYRFTADLTPELTWQTLYEIKGDKSKTFGVAVESQSGDEVYYYKTKVITSGDPIDGYLTVITVVSAATLQETMVERRIATYGFASIIVIILLIILLSYHLRMKSNLAIAEAKSGFAAIVNGSTDAIIGMDLKGRITSWNDSAQTMFGYSEQYVAGKSIFDLNLFQEETLTSNLSAIGGGVSLKAQELLATRRDGNQLDVSLNLSPIQSDAGQILGAAALIRDIGDQKASEEKVRRVNESLEQQVAVRTRELEVARQEAIKSSGNPPEN